LQVAPWEGIASGATLGELGRYIRRAWCPVRGEGGSFLSDRRIAFGWGEKTMIEQVLGSPYVDRGKLLQFLKERFGSDNYSVRVSLWKNERVERADGEQLRLNVWTIFVPEALTQVIGRRRRKHI
jgi:hypothetical protein